MDIQNTHTQTTHTLQAQNKILQMRRDNSRLAGSVPVWNTPQTQGGYVTEKLQTALNAPDGTKTDFQAQNYAASAHSGRSDAEFGFGDLVDMVNPLHHMPLVNMAYRGITGDEIKPVSRVIGGAVFGGGIGAGSALVNVAIEHETGKDLGGHALSMAQKAMRPEASTPRQDNDDPQSNLNTALADLERMDRLGATIALADLRIAPAGSSYESISEFDLSSMPAKRSF